MYLDFSLGQQNISVQVAGLNISCQELAQLVEAQLKTKFFRIAYQDRNQWQIVQMNRSIGCYMDPEKTQSLAIIKYIPIWIYINKYLKIQKEFEFSDKIETVLKSVQQTAENLMNCKILLSSNIRKKIILNQQNYLQQTLSQFEREEMPLHMYIFQEDQNLIGYSQVMEQISTNQDQSTQVSELEIEATLKNDLLSNLERYQLWLYNNSKEVENLIRELKQSFEQKQCLENELHNKMKQNQQFQDNEKQDEQLMLTARSYKKRSQINTQNEEIYKHYQSLVNFVEIQQDEISKFYKSVNDKMEKLKEQSQMICNQIHTLKSLQVNSLDNNLSIHGYEKVKELFEQISISLDQFLSSTSNNNQILNYIKILQDYLKQGQEKLSNKQQKEFLFQ